MTEKHLALWAAALVVAVGLAYAVALVVAVAPRETRDVRLDSAAAQAEMQEAKFAIQDQGDPTQVISYRDIIVHWEGEVPAVCGYFTASDSEDVYHGGQRFIYFRDDLATEDLVGSDVISQQWRDVCVD